MKKKELFGKFEGQDVYAVTLTNKKGASLTVLTYGGIINKLFVPDKDGNMRDVVCGFDNMEDYVTCATSYFGAIIGRYGNRISHGGFTVNGVKYTINNNEADRNCHLHGGNVGFNRKVWKLEESGDNSVVLTHFSPDGDEGYPGNLNVKVTYTFDDDCVMSIHYEAMSDKDTILNLTNHAYYNLNGYDGGSVMEHILRFDCDKYDKVGDDLLPTGEPVSVKGTEFDFLEAHPITVPFDHNFIVNGEIGTLRHAAYVTSPTTGIALDVYTDLPAIQLYTGVGMDGATPFKGGVTQKRLHAFCLETQYSPDTPNRPYMPQCLLKAGDKYDTVTKYAFSVNN